MATNYKSAIDEACRAKRLDEARQLALNWTREEANSPAAWSRLACVYELDRAFDNAARSIGKALALSPNHPPYLFDAGCIDFRRGQFESAATAFGLCASVSLRLMDNYYLDAARIARARCLVAYGQANEASVALDGVADDSATWLEDRITAGELRAQIKTKLRQSLRTFGRDPGA